MKSFELEKDRLPQVMPWTWQWKYLSRAARDGLLKRYKPSELLEWC